jgi:hypothetical protein
MNTMNSRELLASSSFSAEEVLTYVQRLFARLQLLPGEVGTKTHSAAYTALQTEIRVWADRYSKMSKTGTGSAPASVARRPTRSP